ncbi:MAG: TetR/AcrR family transcriptional regulator [Mogibacterium sp.]|nr:TetR/AcrR family transcriptional regulator [Mogibacterium sp.]
MGKIELKKQKKRKDLLEAAYQLFTTVGFHKTTILNIALRAGVGKGTFYLYFDSKEDVRDELIMLKSSRLLLEAVDALERYSREASEEIPVAGKFIFVADYILNRLTQDLTLLKFISKNLSWGILVRSEKYRTVDDEVIDFRAFVIDTLQEGGVELRDPELLLFTLLELINSTCYNTILYNDPVPFKEYKPYLYSVIRRLIDDSLVQ